MKTNLLKVSFAVRCPEEWPARLTLNNRPGHPDHDKPKLHAADAPLAGQPHDTNPDRVTHEKLDLPASVQALISAAVSKLATDIAAIHPELEVAALEVR